MDKKLWVRALTRYLAGFAAVALLLFLSAGTLAYWNGWLFLGILFVPMLALGVFLLIRDPELLEKRLRTKEKEPEQRTVILFSGMMFLTGFVLCGLNYRFSWLVMPPWAAALAAVVFLGGYALYAQVMRENAYLSRTVEVQEGQKVVDTGLYGVVRHPMYLATVLLFLSMPLVLGSPISFLLFLTYPLLLVKRIRNEEQLLAERLDGYRDYQKKVKYRLIPLLW